MKLTSRSRHSIHLSYSPIALNHDQHLAHLIYNNAQLAMIKQSIFRQIIDSRQYYNIDLIFI